MTLEDCVASVQEMSQVRVSREGFLGDTNTQKMPQVRVSREGFLGDTNTQEMSQLRVGRQGFLGDTNTPVISYSPDNEVTGSQSVCPHSSSS